MKCLLNRIGRWASVVVLAAASFYVVSAQAQSADREKKVVVKPGTSALIDTVGCAANFKGDGVVKPQAVVENATRTLILYTSAPDQRDDAKFTYDIGTKTLDGGKGCEGPIVNRQYTITFDAAPEVSATAMEAAFVVLATAFVLALLLESAFALLFNWRVFNVLFVGKAVRTPIMLVGALLVVQKFDLDLMASLMNAYRPMPTVATGNWFTAIVTAMILAGGSAAVNRILVALKLRSMSKDEEPPPQLDETQAWVAVQVEPKRRGDKVRVDLTEVPGATGITPTTIGVAGGQKPTLRSLFFGDNYRVPRSGGTKVSTNKAYTITVCDLGTGFRYDVTGQRLTDTAPATQFKFGPRAILDFHIRIRE